MVAHNLPSVHSQLYTLWGKEDSDEPEESCIREFILVLPDGNATVLYHKGETYETVKLDEVSWFPAPGNGQLYLLLSSSRTTSLNTRCYTSHKVKGFAGDLSVFSSSVEDHTTGHYTIAS